ncbi:nitroimidazol reductase NimA-like FMN-containing flavoprotein (pyridoxamine 5'-phosphate oxidase superfamily) [Streptomyces griseochromogenes]|uniref:DNA-binding protein n=1 Tax=Streptomyces griseochromogenes TaxID=68214 RepID=A0A1B1AVR8_9ACTN|nr:pyridoxamine 5'-phosphate oxidase family protein [Streptomyces griseochromogenes]ANP50620.1 DNA-binding protein [Streptomyces griseochromogenes]MBP2051394.1 nitroimidazol reductase NimA-like FMN-containing flavoprotein (pyridoxamine 5'-phosphate oxidase superfamily) [Streptomyces griseochromogenes]
MAGQTKANVAAPAAAATETPLGDLGRRLAARRVKLGLTRRQAAARAGMAVTYLGYLEEHPGAAPGTSALVRLAEALETTVGELTGGTVDLPPGTGRAGYAPQFTTLRPGECRTLLAMHGVGRLAVPTPTGPVIVPVNYSVVDGAIVFRTARGAAPSLADGRQVAFEVDRIDDAFSQGWSVLVRGPARAVTDPQEQRRLTERAYSAPWAGGSRSLWVRIDAFTITGRRITV